MPAPWWVVSKENITPRLAFRAREGELCRCRRWWVVSSVLLFERGLGTWVVASVAVGHVLCFERGDWSEEIYPLRLAF